MFAKMTARRSVRRWRGKTYMTTSSIRRGWRKAAMTSRGSVCRWSKTATIGYRDAAMLSMSLQRLELRSTLTAMMATEMTATVTAR